MVTENNRCLKILTKSFWQRSKSFDSTKIVSFGGLKAKGKGIEVYSSSNQPPKYYPDLPIWLYGHCSLMTNNHVYCIGGSTDDENGKMTACKKVWQMNINDPTLEWKEVAPLSHRFYSPLDGAVFRDVLVVAGLSDKNLFVSSVEFYQSATNEWRSASPLQEVRSWCSLAANDQHLYAIGGWYNDKCLSSVERTENLKEQWQQVQPMQMPRQWFAAVCCNNVIYAIGGVSDEDKTTNTVEKYDANENRWAFVNNMKTARCSHAACVLSGKIFVVGGWDASKAYVNTIECYNPQTDSWSAVASTEIPLRFHSLVVL